MRQRAGPLMGRGGGNRAAVVVTGIGMVTPLGADRESTWRGVREGRSGMARLPARLYPGAERDAGGLPPLEPCALQGERTLTYAIRAAAEAVEDAALPPRLKEATASVIGCSKGGVITWAAHAPDPAAAPADLLASALPGMAAVRVAEELGLGGCRLSETASCSTGAACVWRGMRLLWRGECEACCVGATDASLTPLLAGGYRNLGAVADADDPPRACRPFDARRGGFLPGEGAAMLILETEAAARRRGARAYASILGLAMGSDGYHQTRPEPSGDPLARVIRSALAEAGVTPRDVGYVNAHATGTRVGDPAEARALRSVFGEGPPASSTKPQTGHLLGASSAVEAALACLALRDGFVPATMNLEDVDPDCRLNHVFGSGQAQAPRVALSVSAGFGGHLAAIVVERGDRE